MNWKNCFAAWVAGLSLVGRLQAAADLPLPPEDETFFGARIPRTMSLLESSRPERRTPVKILIYGQSITAQPGWGQIVRKELERRYPYAKLEIENRAIGGCTAPYLAPHAINDLYPFYPDLVIFQVYEGEHDGALERIFSNIRRRTTAEIITWTEHVDNFIDRDSKREDGAAYRRMLAAKYDIELVEVRECWKRYLLTNNLKRADVLSDDIHLNAQGESLLGRLILRHFRYIPNIPSLWGSTVRTYEAAKPLVDPDGELSLSGAWRNLWGAAEARSAADTLRLEFVGNRVDLVAPQRKHSGKLGTARVLIDGKAPSQHPECHAATRGRCDLSDMRPGVQCVTLGSEPVVEDWTMKILDISPDYKSFGYEFVGSKTGPDGAGKATVNDPVRSASGKVAVSGGFYFGMICPFVVNHDHKSVPREFAVTWKVYLMGADTYAPRCDLPDGEVESHTVAQGLSNSRHVLELIPNGDGPLPLQEIVVHSPPLR